MIAIKKQSGFTPLLSQNSGFAVKSHSLSKGVTGFTLVELLLSSALAALVLVSIYAFYRTGMFSYRKTELTFKALHTSRLLFNRMEQDIKNSFIYADNDSRFTGSNNTMQFLSLSDWYLAGKKYTGICRIRYVVSEGSLTRNTAKGLSAVDTQTNAAEEVIAYKIKHMSFRFAGPTDDPVNPIEWVTVWPKDSAHINTLPLAVNISLSLQADTESGETYDFEKEIPIPISDLQSYK